MTVPPAAPAPITFIAPPGDRPTSTSTGTGQCAQRQAVVIVNRRGPDRTSFPMRFAVAAVIVAACLCASTALAAGGNYPPIWPHPASFTNGTSVTLIDASKFQVCIAYAWLCDRYLAHPLVRQGLPLIWVVVLYVHSFWLRIHPLI